MVSHLSFYVPVDVEPCVVGSGDCRNVRSELLRAVRLRVGGVSIAGLVSRLERVGALTPAARELLGSEEFYVHYTEIQLDLVVLAIGAFGVLPAVDLSMNREFLANWSRAHLRNGFLEHCPPEVGPYLALPQNQALTSGILWVAMPGISASGRCPRTFKVEMRNDGSRRLYAEHAKPTFDWACGKQFVFRFTRV